MEYGPRQLLWDLILHRRAPVDATKPFAEMRHNEHLLPAIRARCDDILDAFGRYHEIVYDIQGLRDQGTDILIRVGKAPQRELICLQIKSEREVRESGLVDRLILQWQRSADFFGPQLLDYYIVLCSEARENADRIREVHAAFAKKAPTIVAPEYAWTFLRHSGMAIDALVRAKVGSEDVVVRAALHLAADLTPTEVALLLFMALHALRSAESELSAPLLLESDFLRSVYDTTPDYERDWFFESPFENDDAESAETEPRDLDIQSRLAEDLDILEGQYVDQAESDRFSLNLPMIEPVLAILLDGSIRYDYEGDELLMYGLELLAGPQLARAREVMPE
jgi:hypothetical protein